MEDPQVRRFALRRAGGPDLAEDALQEAYCAVGRVKDPTQIRDLRAYFCRVLINEVNRLRGQLGATPTDDVVLLADACTGKISGLAPFDETVTMRILARSWVAHFTARRQELTRQVPGRSPDHARYRAVIVSAARRMLRSLLAESDSDADIRATLRADYPEWFADGCAAGNAYQRFSRARADICAVLRKIVNRDDLYS